MSGARGSGTVFFSRCTLRCLYCQNYRWSQGGEGREYGGDDLRRMLVSLRGQGCHNWNLVTATPWLPMVVEALDRVKDDGLDLPVVYNTSGFERIETLAELEGCVDVYLADLRYALRETAAFASGRPEYVAIARDALVEMWRQKGALKLDGEGAATSGTICRLLILPDHAKEAVDNLRWLADAIGTDIAVSVMSQYIPAHRAMAMEGWNRRISRAEYDEVCAVADDLGFHSGWIQEFDQAASDGLIGFNMEPSRS